MESSEKRLKEKVLAMLRREFGDAWVYKTSDRWKAGIPDVLICRKGRFLRRSLRSGITRLREYSFTFLNRLNVPVGVWLCVVVWIRSGIYLLTKEVI